MRFRKTKYANCIDSLFVLYFFPLFASLSKSFSRRFFYHSSFLYKPLCYKLTTRKLPKLTKLPKITHYTNFIVILGFLAIYLTACANESVYRGGLGAFKDYEALASYRSVGKAQHFANQVFENERFEKAFGKTFSNREKNTSFGKSFEQNFTASNAPIDSFSGGGASLMYGMRESQAIQRATMRPYQIAGKWYYPTQVKIGETFDGIASWYGPNFHAKKTSNGETYNMHAHTAASKTLPMNTIVKVLNKENGKTTIVRINDRGPFVDGRIIDLSNVAAKDIDMVTKGTAKVRLEVIGFGGKVDKNYQNSLNVSNEAIQDEFEVGETKEAVAGGVFSLQVGVFKLKDGAQATKKKFDDIAKEYNVFIKEDNDLYRVFVQGFSSEAEAQDFAKSNGLTPIIVRE